MRRIPKILRQTSTEECINTILNGKLIYFSIFVKFFIVRNFEPLNLESALKLIENFKEKCFLMTFRCLKSNSTHIYWKRKSEKQILYLNLNGTNEAIDYIVNFLSESLEKNLNGEFDSKLCKQESKTLIELSIMMNYEIKEK